MKKGKGDLQIISLSDNQTIKEYAPLGKDDIWFIKLNSDLKSLVVSNDKNFVLLDLMGEKLYDE